MQFVSKLHNVVSILVSSYAADVPKSVAPKPSAGPGSWRIGLICFLATWHRRALNQALVSSCLALLE